MAKKDQPPSRSLTKPRSRGPVSPVRETSSEEIDIDEGSRRRFDDDDEELRR